MPKFSQASIDKLKTCDPRLQLICNRVIEMMDFSVICGYRDEVAQRKAFNAGMSKLQYPNSKHNKSPSLAVDLAPYPLDKDIRPYYFLAGLMLGIAKEVDIELRWGGNWKNDGDILDNKFNDLGHFEIKI